MTTPFSKTNTNINNDDKGHIKLDVLSKNYPSGKFLFQCNIGYKCNTVCQKIPYREFFKNLNKVCIVPQN